MRQYRLLCTLAAVLLVSTAAGLTAGQDPTTQPAKQPGRPPNPALIQEIQEVSAVGASAAPTVADWIGRMHPALVHFPIAWVFLLLVVEVVALVTGGAHWFKAGLPLLIISLVAMLPAVVTGFLRASSMGTEPEFTALMVPHRNLNIAAALTCLLALGLRLAWGNKLTMAKRRIYLFLIAGAAALMLLAGHLGGKMVFGKDFLPF